jgi:hypothetical protein
LHFVFLAAPQLDVISPMAIPKRYHHSRFSEKVPAHGHGDDAPGDRDNQRQVGFNDEHSSGTKGVMPPPSGLDVEQPTIAPGRTKQHQTLLHLSDPD